MKFRYIAAALILAGAIAVFIQEKQNKIAVLNIEGVILSSGTYLEALKEIERDDSFKALVVRVDSPGRKRCGFPGNLLSHKAARRKDSRDCQHGKHSRIRGGYYVACGASSIMANPGTITGSIGVIATFANYGELLRWAKIDFDVVKTGELKDVGSPLRPLAPEDAETYSGDDRQGA